MSHFNVAVFSHTPDEVDVLLEPFNEQVGFGSPYGVYEKYDEDDTSGEQGRWYNPNARWDWYCVGGRWAGQLKLLEGKTGRYGSDYTPDEERKLPKGRCDSAHVLDCDFSQDQEAYRKALRFPALRRRRTLSLASSCRSITSSSTAPKRTLRSISRSSCLTLM